MSPNRFYCSQDKNADALLLVGKMSYGISLWNLLTIFVLGALVHDPPVNTLVGHSLVRPAERGNGDGQTTSSTTGMLPVNSSGSSSGRRLKYRLPLRQKTMMGTIPSASAPRPMINTIVGRDGMDTAKTQAMKIAPIAGQSPMKMKFFTDVKMTRR